MVSGKMQEILRSIIGAVLGASISNDAPLVSQLDGADWSRKLSRAVNEELGVVITPEEIASSGSLRQLASLLESRLNRDPMGRSLVDVYTIVERLAKEEYHPDINYHWYARWDDFLNTGNWLTAPDSYDAVEVVIRMQDEFGFGISDQDAQAMQTVGQAVRYLWNRSCAQGFVLRQRLKGVCQSAFIFHELRRLLMVRGGVPRSAVRLDSRLGDLLPSWSTQFWKQAQDIFQVNLPQGHLLAFKWRIESRTTVKELVSLIASSQTLN